MPRVLPRSIALVAGERRDRIYYIPALVMRSSYNKWLGRRMGHSQKLRDNR